MTSTPQEPVDAAEYDSDEETVAALIRTEDDLPDRDEDEVEVGLGPEA